MDRTEEKTEIVSLSPVLVRYDASLHFLMVLPYADGQPGAQLAVVQGVHHSEHLSLVEAQAVRRLLLILKVGPDVERVAHIRLHDPPVHWTRTQTELENPSRRQRVQRQRVHTHSKERDRELRERES